MRLQGWRFWGLAALLLALNVGGLLWIHHDLTGGKKPHVRILSVFPVGPAGAADRFSLHFDEPLAALEMVGKPLAAAPFVLQPQPPGHWQWSAPEQLEFVLAKKLPPGRQYVLRPAPDGENRIGHEIIGEKEFNFNTEPLAWTGCNLVKADQKKFTFELTFNQPVHPVDVLEFMKVYDVVPTESAKIEMRALALSHEPGTKLVFQADRPKSDKVEITLSNKLTGVGAQLGLVGDNSHAIEVPAKFALLKAEPQDAGTDKLLTVNLQFSQDLDPKAPLPEVTVTPAVKDLVVSRGEDHQYRERSMRTGADESLNGSFRCGTDVSLIGTFKCGAAYHAIVRAGALSATGQTIDQDETLAFEFADRNPSLDFPAGRGVLSPQGNLKVDVDVVNLSGVRLTAWKLHANNLAAFLQKNGGGDADTGRDLLSKTVKVNVPRNEVTRLAVDIKGMVGSECGVYSVQASGCSPSRGIGDESPWGPQDNAVVAVTDLGITVKKHRQGLMVWVTSLQTAKPVPGAKVSAITRNNQTLAWTHTDAEGLATLTAPANSPDGPVWLVTAELGGDLAYLLPEENTWEKDHVANTDAAFEAHVARPAPITYDAMLYTERGVYRPGETVFLTGILRDAAGRVPPPFPLSVAVTRPDGKKVADLPIKPDATGQGLFHAQFTPPEDGQSGQYTFNATLPGDEHSLGDTQAGVESFVPVRMEVKARAQRDRYGPGEQPRADISARYLFGQPAAHLPVTIAGSYRPTTFRSDKYKDYIFGNGRLKKINVTGWQDLVRLTLDTAGTVTVTLPMPVAPPPAKRVAGIPPARGEAILASRPADILSAGAAGILPASQKVGEDAGRMPATHEGETPSSHADKMSASPTTQPTSQPASGPASEPARVVPAEPGVYEADLYATVTEEGGRSVSAGFTTLLDTAGRHIGLRLPPEQILRSRTKIPVGWVQLTTQDELAAPGAMKCVLSRIEWDWVIQKVNNEQVWKSVELATPVWSRDYAKGELAAATGQFEMLCPTGGQYRLEVTDAATGNSTLTEFYASEGDDNGLAQLVREPERLEIVLDKKEYLPGASAKVVVRSPLAGTLLLTLETDRVLDQRVMPMASKTAELTLPLPATLRGGAFVTATVVGAIDPSRPKWLPHRAMGLARIETSHAGHKIELAIDAPPKAQPGQRLQVKVRATAPLDPSCPPLLHLWAVDEGILLTTDFRTPAPLEHFFGARMLEVESSDLFDQLMPDYQRPADILSIGGGDSLPEKLRLRNSPIPVRTRASAVIWRTAVPVAPDGTATAELEMPRLSGQMRLMAVCVDHDQYGSQERPVTVTSSLLVEAAWPRFAAPGDTFQVPVKVFNTTDKPLTVAVSLQSSGQVTNVTNAKSAASTQPASAAAREPRQFTDNKEDLGTLTIPPNESKILWANEQALALGQVKAVVTAKAAGSPELSAQCESLFTIRPAAPLEVETRLLKLDAGKSLRLEALKDFLPGASRTTVTIAGNPVVNLLPALERLIEYPYGCVEQTTSKLYGMVYTPQLLALTGATKGRTDAVREMVDAGIARLWSMQTREGGIGYWPGDHEPNLWGTAYAACFLTQAKRAGYAVDKRFSDELVKYLQEQMRQPTVKDEMTENMRAMICDVLAALAAPDESWMNRLGERPDKLDIAGRAHLAAAWLTVGRKDLAAKTLGADTVNLSVPTTTGGMIASQPQEEATLLCVMLDLDPSHAWVPHLVDKLDHARKNACYWGTTVENAMSLAALAKFQARTRPTQADFTGTAKTPDGKETPFEHLHSTRLQFDGDGAGTRIDSKGTGTVYIAQTTEGVLRKAGGFETYDRQLEVRRTWTDREGNAVDPAKLKVGDIVIVNISCRTIGDAHIRNVAIVDALPGAMEVEHPSLMTSAHVDNYPNIQVPGDPDRTEFRDDRVILFVSASKISASYRYALRVISAGSYQLPPIQASCMYDPSFASINGGGKVEVKR